MSAISAPAAEVSGSPLGTLYAIGGAEAKLRGRTVLRSFLTDAGGPSARIAVIPTASSLGPEVVEVYHAAFTALGAAEVSAVRPETRTEAADAGLVARIDAATGVFMTGGNQLKLASVITGTPVGDAIVRAYHRGAVVGGTSAGASILSDHMIAFGVGGATPKQRMSQQAAGLGLLTGTIVDQHFDQRNRYGRLLSLIAQSPSLLGIGVDEDTAAVVRNGHRMEVVGRGSVFVVDAGRISTNAHSVKANTPLMISGAVLHVLPRGSYFDLTRRRLIPTAEALPAEEVAEVEEAEQNLRQLARDIAADDVSPANYARRLRRAARS